MDHNLDSNYTLTEYPIYEPPVPDAILEDHSDDSYLICWKPTDAGILHKAPELVNKEDFKKQHPHIVETWKANQRHEESQAREMEQNFLAFANRFLDRGFKGFVATQSHDNVICDQNLRPGMLGHWGEVRRCQRHPTTRTDFLTCKGCRVGHYAQQCRTFDRRLIMARGARVPVCHDCSDAALEEMESPSCVCDHSWTCYRCRETELDRLAKAREKYIEGQCGRCLGQKALVHHVDFCLYCQGWRAYIASKEDLQVLKDCEAREESATGALQE
jgi:hypothetical protein